MRSRSRRIELALALCACVAPARAATRLPERVASPIGDTTITVGAKTWHVTLLRRVLRNDEGADVDELTLALDGPGGRRKERLRSGTVSRYNAEHWKPFIETKHIGKEELLLLRLPEVTNDTFITIKLYKVSLSGRLTQVLEAVKAGGWGGSPCVEQTSFDVQPDGDDGQRVQLVSETTVNSWSEEATCDHEGKTREVVRFEWKGGCYARVPEDDGLDRDLNLAWERVCVPGAGRR
jgi:hypothetical protein